jgi:hypothetical protein
MTIVEAALEAAKGLHLYQVRYRREGTSARIYRMTVQARNADEARAYVKARDPLFAHTTASPKKGRAIEPPESSDGLTAAKVYRRDDLVEGVAHFEWHGHDIEVPVVD